MRSWAVPFAMLACSLLPASGAELQPPENIAGIESCGASAFRLPGSNGCIRLGGSVTSETVLRSGGDSRASKEAAGRFQSRADAKVTADVRVPTDLGPLRIYGSVRSWRGF